MELSKRIENYFILGKFLKLNGVGEETLGKIFNMLLEELTLDDLNIFINKDKFEFCQITTPEHFIGEDFANKTELTGCNDSGLTEEEKFNRFVSLFIYTLDSSKSMKACK